MTKLFQTKRRLSVKEKLNILFYTYGSLTDFRLKQHGSHSVARMLDLCQPTVFNLLKRFEQQQQFSVDEFLKVKKKPGRPIKVLGSQAIERLLIDPITLTRWAHLTLAQRSIKIFREYNVKVCRYQLSRFYRRKKVSYRQTSLKYYPHGRCLQQLEEERIEFADILSSHIANDRQIVYFDETTFNCDNIQNRAWFNQQVMHLQLKVFRNQKFIIPAARTRGKGYTVYGAVSTCLRYRNSCFSIGSSTNTIEFLEFIEKLGGQIKAKYRNPKPILVLDNHSAHKGVDRDVVMERYFEVIFIPAYSCELNQPIETAWSVLKGRVKKKFTELLIKKQMTRDKSIALVRKELTLIKPHIFANILRTHWPYLQSLLDKFANGQYIAGTGVY